MGVGCVYDAVKSQQTRSCPALEVGATVSKGCDGRMQSERANVADAKLQTGLCATSSSSSLGNDLSVLCRSSVRPRMGCLLGNETEQQTVPFRLDLSRCMIQTFLLLAPQAGKAISVSSRLQSDRSPDSPS